MKCSNPHCNRSIGLIAHRQGWSKRRYCSRQCRDASVAEWLKRSQKERNATTYFEWLFTKPIENLQPKLTPAIVRVKAR
jgi:hypothetical protein